MIPEILLIFISWIIYVVLNLLCHFNYPSFRCHMSAVIVSCNFDVVFTSSWSYLRTHWRIIDLRVIWLSILYLGRSKLPQTFSCQAVTRNKKTLNSLSVRQSRPKKKKQQKFVRKFLQSSNNRESSVSRINPTCVWRSRRFNVSTHKHGTGANLINWLICTCLLFSRGHSHQQLWKVFQHKNAKSSVTKTWSSRAISSWRAWSITLPISGWIAATWRPPGSLQSAMRHILLCAWGKWRKGKSRLPDLDHEHTMKSWMWALVGHLFFWTYRIVETKFISQKSSWPFFPPARRAVEGIKMVVRLPPPPPQPQTKQTQKPWNSIPTVASNWVAQS